MICSINNNLYNKQSKTAYFDKKSHWTIGYNSWFGKLKMLLNLNVNNFLAKNVVNYVAKLKNVVKRPGIEASGYGKVLQEFEQEGNPVR